MTALVLASTLRKAERYLTEHAEDPELVDAFVATNGTRALDLADFIHQQTVTSLHLVDPAVPPNLVLVAQQAVHDVVERRRRTIVEPGDAIQAGHEPEPAVDAMTALWPRIVAVLVGENGPPEWSDRVTFLDLHRILVLAVDTLADLNLLSDRPPTSQQDGRRSRDRSPEQP